MDFFYCLSCSSDIVIEDSIINLLSLDSKYLDTVSVLTVYSCHLIITVRSGCRKMPLQAVVMLQ